MPSCQTHYEDLFSCICCKDHCLSQSLAILLCTQKTSLQFFLLKKWKSLFVPACSSSSSYIFFFLLLLKCDEHDSNDEGASLAYFPLEWDQTSAIKYKFNFELCLFFSFSHSLSFHLLFFSFLSQAHTNYYSE